MGDPDLETLVREFLASAPPPAHSQRELKLVADLLAYGYKAAVPEQLMKNARREELVDRINSAEETARLARAELARLR